MKKPGRRAIVLILGGLLVIALGIIIVTFIMRQMMAPAAPAPQPTPVMEQVLVTSRGVPVGAVLAPDDLTLQSIPIELVPLSRMTDPVTAIGKIATVSMVAGEMVLPHHLLDTTNVIDRSLAFTLEDDQVLMAFPILDLMTNLNILKKGDLIDILVTIEETILPDEPLAPDEEAPTLMYTFDAMQRLTITAIVMDIVGEAPPPQAIPTPGSEATPMPPPEPSRTQTEPVALMLALNPQDALVLKHLLDSGAIFTIVLRSPNSTRFFETVPVTSQFLIDRYGLEVPK